jgi:nicotinamide-nucleotide amidase
MNVEIITIGDEILIGQIVDTNSAWMATELNCIGIKVAQITSVSDSAAHLAEALDNARKRVDIVLMTGGLGPTKDDLTKKVLCSYFQRNLVLHQPTLFHVANFFKKRGLELTQLNHDQALVIDGCEVLFNECGTAPGMWIEHEGVIFVSMPGVPFEMKGLMESAVLPRLAARSGIQKIVHKTILTFGIGESFLADKIELWENNLPECIKLAYLPSPGQVRLRLTAVGNSEEELLQLVDEEVQKLRQLIPEYIFGYNNDTLASVVGELLMKKGCFVATAESCTGGNIAHEITSIPGSSRWFQGSVVAYSNPIKTKLLAVSEANIEQDGAVSESVVRQMAEGVRKMLGADYAMATSGIAGPDGGTPDKPVGTVWIAVAGPNGIITEKFNFANNRERNIIRSTQAALNMLRLYLLGSID